MSDIELSDHFKLSEFTKSDTALKHNIDNQVHDTSIACNLTALCEKVLEPVRAIAGRSLAVTSGYRSAALNKRVGGASNSQHLFGEAADIVPAGGEVMALALAVRMREDIPFDQLIFENRMRGGQWRQWIHISHRRTGDNRGEVLTIVIDDNGTQTFAGIHDPDDVLKRSKA
jgi:hypothetical protein